MVLNISSRHPFYTKDTLSPTADRHMLYESKYEFMIERHGEGELLALYLTVQNKKDGQSEHRKFYQYDNNVGNLVDRPCDDDR